MAGQALRNDRNSAVHVSVPSMEPQRRRLLGGLRKQLIDLALNSRSPDDVLRDACRAVRAVIQGHCAFIEGENIPEAAPGYTSFAVETDGLVCGALMVQWEPSKTSDFSNDDLREIAALVGLALINARQAEAAAELQSDSEDMLFHAPDAIFVIAPNDVIVMANRRMQDFVRTPPDGMVGRTADEVFDATDVRWRALAACAENGELHEVELSSAAGRRLVSIAPSFVSDESVGRILCVVRDITAERQAHLAIRRTERNRTMGQAVEYLLHEVNNPLSALRANLDQVRRRANEAISARGEPGPTDAIDRLLQALSSAETAASRIRETMSSLRAAHVGFDRPMPAVVDPSYEITLALSGLESEFPGNDNRIIREESIHSNLHTVPLTIAESVGALVRNALQALAGRSGGEVRIRAVETEKDLCITVSDNGPGIPRDFAARIFMPFFTTKPLRRNLGLGLTMVDDSLRRIGGTVRLVPSGEPGARFEITIPK